MISTPSAGWPERIFHLVEEKSRWDLAEGEVAAYDVCETWVGLAEVDGQVYAIGDLCTHAGCSLAKGQLEGTTVTCSCHGSQFDVTTGEVLRGPAAEPVPSYRVKIERGVVYVEI